MSEWSLLNKNLKDVLDVWPRELIALLADYVFARIHEWNEKISETELCAITRSQITILPQNSSMVAKASSKYSLDVGPSRWALDIQFKDPSKPPLDAYIFVGLSRSGRWICGKSFLTDGITLTTFGPADCFELPITQSKHRIYVTVHKERERFYWNIGIIYVLRLLDVLAYGA